MDAREEEEDFPPVSIVGSGAVATVLGRRLANRGHHIEAILSRHETTAKTLADRVGAPVASAEWDALPADVRLVLVCVSDAAIADVAEALASVEHAWADTTVAHTSGARTTEVLDSLTQKGATPLSFHPVQTFTLQTDPAVFEDVVIGIEGTPAAMQVGERLAHTLGGRVLPLTAAEKVRYHCAATLASNGLVALMGVVEEVLGGTETIKEKPSGRTLFRPLVEQTLSNVVHDSPDSALTGPAARGDQETVRDHLDMLAEKRPHLTPLYAALSTEMIRIAVRGGQLKKDRAEALLNVLQNGLSSSDVEAGSSNSSN